MPGPLALLQRLGQPALPGQMPDEQQDAARIGRGGGVAAEEHFCFRRLPELVEQQSGSVQAGAVLPCVRPDQLGRRGGLAEGAKDVNAEVEDLQRRQAQPGEPVEPAPGLVCLLVPQQGLHIVSDEDRVPVMATEQAKEFRARPPGQSPSVSWSRARRR